MPDSVPGKVPPQNVEAEMCVLGSIFLDNEVTGDVLEVVKAEDFYKKAHKVIYEIMLELYEQNHGIDLVIMRDLLKKRDELDAFGGSVYLTQIVESVPSAANAVHYAQIVREKAISRGLISTTTRILQSAYDGSKDSNELVDTAERLIFEIAEKRYSASSQNIKDVLKETFSMLESMSGPGGLGGLRTGFFDLDEQVNGLQPSQLIIVAGRPSMGKTSFALNICRNIAVESEKPVAIFSLEMASTQIVQNILCAQAQVNAHRLRKSQFGETEYQSLNMAAGVLSESPIFIDDTPALTPLELRAKARRLKARHDIQLIAIDYLQLMDPVTRSQSRQQEITEISRSLKALARELNVPVIALSQLSRGTEQRPDKKPRLSDLRESGAIEQDADVVMLLFRPEYYDETKEPGQAQVIIAKQRNGPTGTINLFFQKEQMRFESLSIREE